MSVYADLVPRYQQLRRLSRQMNNALLKEIPRDVMDEAGRKLGILRRGVMVFDSEEDTAILADACLHDIRRQGQTVVERVQAEAPYPPGSDEMRLLAGLKDAHYSVFVIEATEPGVGIQVRDTLGDEARFIMDMGFGSTTRPGMVLAGRVFVVAGITMTTGAAIPMGTLPAAALERKVRRFLKGTADSPAELTSREARSAFALRLVRDLRKSEATANVSYVDPGTPGQGRGPAVGRAWQASRNDPCPCGSGKKFKQCCGASR